MTFTFKTNKGVQLLQIAADEDKSAQINALAKRVWGATSADNFWKEMATGLISNKIDFKFLS